MTQTLVRMPRKRRTGGGDAEVPSVASQVDEADVVAAVGAEEDPDTGTMVADEDRVRAAGAVDAESVRENQRLQRIVDQKRGGMKVPFNAGDILTKYDTLLRLWPANTLEIGVKRLTGTQTQYTIKSQPRSGTELYDALMQIHGRSGEAAYDVRVLDSNQKQIRTTGQITLPDMQATPPPQQGQPMNPYYPQQQQPPPQGYTPQQPPPGYAPPGYAPQYPQPQQYPQQPQQSAAPTAVVAQPPQPVVHVMPPAQSPFDVGAMMAMQQQMFEMFKQMMPQAPPAAYPQQPQQSPPPPAMPAMPPPPQSADPQAMMAWMQQMFGLFQQMQQQAAATAARTPPAPAQPSPTPEMAGMPPVQAPPGMMFVPGFGYVPVEKLFYALSDRPDRPGPYGGGPYRGPRPPPYYGGQGPQDPGVLPQSAPYSGGGPYPPHQQQPQQRQMTAAESFRDAITIVKSAASAIEEFRSILPDQQPAAAAEPVREEDDSPVRVIDAGPAKLVINRVDGTARYWETGWANADKILKWVGEQREAIQKANVDQQNAQQPRQQLPPGYVEVTPGYVPPPGYVAIPVEQIPQHVQPQPAPAQGGLPQPPQQMPPPIAEQPTTTRRAWSAPTIPGGGR